MPDSRPTSSQPSRYSYPLELLVLACLGVGLVLSWAALVAHDRDLVVDANGNPAVPKIYGYAAGRP